MNEKEYRRCRRVIEWMLTAHSTLRDRYTRRSRALTLTVMALSIIGLLFALASNEHVRILGLETMLQTVLAWLSGLVFFVSLLDLIVDWRAQAWRHEDAAARLGELSMLFRRATEDDAGNFFVEGIDLAVEYDRTMAAIHTLPEKKVVSLKARHNRKRAVFTRADENPGAPAWLLRLQVLRDSLAGRLERPAPSRQAPPAAESEERR